MFNETELHQDVLKLVKKYGLEGAWENITYMQDDNYKWNLKIIYKTIFKLNMKG